MQLLIGFVAGIVVATIGFAGVAEIADTGVQKLQDTVKEVTK
jgi:hypothetical protein